MNHPIDSLGAEEAAASWRTSAVGKRPRDYAARDFLLRAGFPQRFSKRFSRLLEQPLDALAPVVDAIPPGGDRQQALAIATHHYLHLERLEIVERDANDVEAPRIQRLRRCPPHGVLGNWKDQADDRFLRPCDLARVCPWCLARSTMQWMARIERRWRSRTDVYCLLLSRVQLDDEMLDEVVLGRDLRRRLLHLRQAVFPVLRQTAESFGVLAGVNCLQAAPLRSGKRPDLIWRHAYHAALLGFIEGSGVRMLHQAFAGRPTAPLIEFGRYAARQALTFERPSSLAVRRLVTGWRERWPEPDEPLQRYGLVVRPTWNAAPAHLWLNYFAESSGIPTFTTFGQFTLDERDHEVADPQRVQPETPSERSGSNATNLGRHLEAVARRDALAARRLSRRSIAAATSLPSRRTSGSRRHGAIPTAHRRPPRRGLHAPAV